MTQSTLMKWKFLSIGFSDSQLLLNSTKIYFRTSMILRHLSFLAKVKHGFQFVKLEKVEEVLILNNRLMKRNRNAALLNVSDNENLTVALLETLLHFE